MQSVFKSLYVYCCLVTLTYRKRNEDRKIDVSLRLLLIICSEQIYSEQHNNCRDITNSVENSFETMADESNAWVFDSLIGFLHGPVWNAPLQTFIEEKSLIFDPNESSDENSEEYKKIYDEYKHLVDFMLGSFMEEMQITPEQFEVACLAGKHSASGVSFHQGLFQQIWAANDMRIFVRMMTQRNVELQLQALDVIERRHLNSTASSSIDDGDIDVASSSSVSIEKPIPEHEHEQGEEELDDVIEEEMKKSVASELADSTTMEEADAVKASIVDDQVEKRMQRLNLYFEKENKVDADEVKSRQEYLRMQRDKIVALKRKVRTEQLNVNAEKTGRPSSAQAAQRLLLSDTKIDDTQMEASLQLRKTLAKRLRNEVVDSKE